MVIIVFHVQCCSCLEKRDRAYFRDLFGGQPAGNTLKVNIIVAVDVIIAV